MSTAPKVFTARPNIKGASKVQVPNSDSLCQTVYEDNGSVDANMAANAAASSSVTSQRTLIICITFIAVALIFVIAYMATKSTNQPIRAIMSHINPPPKPPVQDVQPPPPTQPPAQQPQSQSGGPQVTISPNPTYVPKDHDNEHDAERDVDSAAASMSKQRMKTDDDEEEYANMRPKKKMTETEVRDALKNVEVPEESMDDVVDYNDDDDEEVMKIMEKVKKSKLDDNSKKEQLSELLDDLIKLPKYINKEATEMNLHNDLTKEELPLRRILELMDEIKTPQFTSFTQKKTLREKLTQLDALRK